MDALKVELIARDFNRMLEEFADIDPSVEFRDIVRGVVIRVLAGAVRRTKSGNADRIKLSYNSREWITMDGKKYRLGYETGEGWHMPDPLWGRIETRRAARLQAKLGAIGLSKRSWTFFEQEIGGIVDAPAYVREAHDAKGSGHPENAQTFETGTGTNYALRIINSSRIVQRAGGEAALVWAMNGETRYFFMLLSKHAFANAALRAAKYPGVYVRELTSAAAAAG